MSFLTSQRDDRRRRMMTAGADQPNALVATPRRSPARASKPSSDGTTDGQTRGYTDSALRKYQPRVMDFVPIGGWKVSAALLAIVSLVATMATLHLWLPAKISLDLTGTALDLAAPIGLATWMATAMLLASSVLALVVYSIRSHKIDDYRGRYRVWRHAAFGWLVLSLAVGSNLSATVEMLMTFLASGTLAGNAALWWAMPAAVLVSYLTVALLVDMRRCRLGSTALVLAVTVWTFATASKLDWLPLDALEQPRIEATALLTGHCLLLMAMTFYARFVIRESRGIVVPRPKKVKVTTPATKTETTSTEPVAEPTDTESPQPRKRFFKLRRDKKARVEPAHEDEETVPRPHVSTRKLAAKDTANDADRVVAKATPSAAPTKTTSSTLTKMVKKNSAARKTHSDPVAEEVERLEGLGGRLSKSQRKKLRKLRRQLGESEE